MNLNLENKVIVVSGGAKGIGRGICIALAKEKAKVAVIDRSAEASMEIIQELESLGAECFAVKAELTQPDDCKNAIDVIVNKFGKIDGLVNNAGKNDGISLENGSYDDFMNSLHLNLVHYYLLAHHSLPYLKMSKGAIVNIGSKVAETGQGSTSAYAAANGGRNALTREWAVELLKYKIRVNAVIVAECLTPLYKDWLRTLPEPEEKLREIAAKIPFENRLTTTEELANTVVFLLSDKSSHTTGQLIHVDGGYVHLDRSIS